MIEFSIIIVSWNTRELLENCLRSIYGCSPEREFEVFVVDNNSTDGTGEMVREKFPEVEFIYNQENVGFARANNQAIMMSRGRYVILLNPDTVVLSDAIAKMTSFIDSHPAAGAVGPKLLNPNHTLQHSCYPIPTLSREFWRLFHLDRIWTFATYPMDMWGDNEPRRVDVIQGACMMIRKQAIDEIGLLDEDYFIYTEEVDFCYRLLQAGWEIYWIGMAEVIHFGEQSTKQLHEEMFLHLYQSKITFFRKHYGTITASIYKLILTGAAVGRLLFLPISLIKSPTTRNKHFKIARNYRNLLSQISAM